MDFSRDTIHFMRIRGTMLLLSGALILGAVASLATQGLNFGIDFTGGTLVELKFTDADANPQQVRDVLLEEGFENFSAQDFGDSGDILIRLAPQPQDAEEDEDEDADSSADRVGDTVLRVFRDAGYQAELRRIEFVGPQVGQELTRSGAWAMLYALGGILLYVALRFQLRFSAGAIAALVHDVIITLGIFSLTQLNFDLSVLAAILAVIGYSLNDTIVIYDRVRENFRLLHKSSPLEVVDTSLTQTLGRTIVTSLTTILVLLALLTVGGELIRPFALALLIGVIVGTYSSIYVANPIILLLGISRKDLQTKEKPGADSAGIVT